MFGLHPNAEINYLTSMCDSVFNTIMNISGKVGGGGGSIDNQQYNILMDYKNRLPVEFNLNEINSRIKDKNPNVVVCLQECERMNILLGEIKSTLEDLRLGITGALNMSDAMELLSSCLTLNKVPSSWELVAYFSKKLLANWFTDLLERVKQLQEWSAKEIVTPKSLCISYLFNPMSFLTAVMQNTARLDGYPLDNMAL
jgi:dynein heavy chain